MQAATRRSCDDASTERKQVPVRAIAPVGEAESTVRYHLERARTGASDGRQGRLLAAAVIEAWHAAQLTSERLLNVRELYEHLVQAHSMLVVVEVAATARRPQRAADHCFLRASHAIPSGSVGYLRLTRRLSVHSRAKSR